MSILYKKLNFVLSCRTVNLVVRAILIFKIKVKESTGCYPPPVWNVLLTMA